MRRTKIKAECLYFDSGIAMQVDDLLTMGSRKLKDLSKRKTDLARIYTDTIAQLAEITQEWEENQDTWEASAIGGSVYDHPFALTRIERLELKRAGFTTVSQLFLTDEPRSFEKTVTINILKLIKANDRRA